MASHSTCRVRTLVSASLAALAGSLALHPGASVAKPDLVADPPGSPYVEVNSGFYGSARLLVRFDGYVHNRGPGPLEVRGTGGSGGLMSVVQQRNDSGGWTTLPRATIRFENNDLHNHWHLMAAARYSLWKGDRSVLVAPANKVGFCLLDNERREGSAPAAFPYIQGVTCEQGHSSASTVSMGLSPGWRDEYSASTALQWVDASNVAPGTYVVSSEVDPDDLISEQADANPRNWAGTGTVIPGYLAIPVTAGTAPVAGGQVSLQATRFGSPGQRQFKIVRPPAHGTLDKPVNTWFSDPNITYRPALGHTCGDSFDFVARDASSQFPLSPPSAAVTVPPTLPGTCETQVAISGAPAAMYAGTSAQLSGSVVDGPSSHVNWQVTGITGGTSVLGVITGSGLYTAPASPPPGGAVEVSATSDDGATDSARIDILPKPEPTPAPSVRTPRFRGAMSRIAANRHGRLLVVKLMPGYSGRLKIVVRDGKKRLAARRIKVTRRRAVSARFRLPRAYRGDRPRRHLKVTAALRSSRGKLVAVRRARVR